MEWRAEKVEDVGNTNAHIKPPKEYFSRDPVHRQKK